MRVQHLVHDRPHPAQEPLPSHVVGNDRPDVAVLVTLDHEAVAHWLTMLGKPRMPQQQLVRDPTCARPSRGG
ncbi:hypothetical protein ADK77_29210 [Streptomyces antibioticus]|nr:hypothetical protein ADK77_29210 [Streptomyces antibioticus]